VCARALTYYRRYHVPSSQNYFDLTDIHETTYKGNVTRATLHSPFKFSDMLLHGLRRENPHKGQVGFES